MTTPENFRRRQRIEGIGLIILAIITILMGLYFQGQNTAQRECLRTQVQDLTTTFHARGNLTAQESQATRKIITDALSSKTHQQLEAAKRQYKASLRHIDQGRANHPIPDPTGECK